MNQDKNDVLLAERVAARGLSAVQNKDETGALQAVLGLNKATAGNYSEAADWYLAAALMNPTNVQYWLQASTMLSPNRDLKFAENVLLQGLESHPNSPQLLYQMGTGTTNFLTYPPPCNTPFHTSSYPRSPLSIVVSYEHSHALHQPCRSCHSFL